MLLSPILIRLLSWWSMALRMLYRLKFWFGIMPSWLKYPKLMAYLLFSLPPTILKLLLVMGAVRYIRDCQSVETPAVRAACSAADNLYWLFVPGLTLLPSAASNLSWAYSGPLNTRNSFMTLEIP